jgi:hypothetical protein
MSETMTSVGAHLSLPPFPTLNGANMELQALRGKKVVLFMWGSW